MNPQRFSRIILDLCGGSGAWSKNYQEAGYIVKVITLPEYDLLDESIVEYCISLNPYGILFAVECTPWANSGARWFDTRSPREIFYYSRLLVKGLRIIMATNPSFWCIENPVGKMRDFLGKPRLIFNPCDYGDPYTKKTCLWGRFAIPQRTSVLPSKGSMMNKLPDSKGRSVLRSITPPGFARAFYEANK